MRVRVSVPAHLIRSWSFLMLPLKRVAELSLSPRPPLPPDPLSRDACEREGVGSASRVGGRRERVRRRGKMGKRFVVLFGARPKKKKRAGLVCGGNSSSTKRAPRAYLLVPSASPALSAAAAAPGPAGLVILLVVLSSWFVLVLHDACERGVTARLPRPCAFSLFFLSVPFTIRIFCSSGKYLATVPQCSDRCSTCGDFLDAFLHFFALFPPRGRCGR